MTIDGGEGVELGMQGSGSGPEETGWWWLGFQSVSAACSSRRLRNNAQRDASSYLRGLGRRQRAIAHFPRPAAVLRMEGWMPASASATQHREREDRPRACSTTTPTPTTAAANHPRPRFFAQPAPLSPERRFSCGRGSDGWAGGLLLPVPAATGCPPAARGLACPGAPSCTEACRRSALTHPA